MIYDYIIIGGGLAGLAVAEGLAKKKHDVLLLEQYPVFGGRVSTEHVPKTAETPALQYEVGAGRIFHSHKRVAALVKRYGLKTYPIGADSLYEGKRNDFVELFAPIRDALESLPRKTLATHTIKDLVPSSMHSILTKYPYTSEIETLRADAALPLFKPKAPMAAAGAAFYGLVGGLDQLAVGKHKDAVTAGADCRVRYKVSDVTRGADGIMDVVGMHGKKDAKRPFHVRCRDIIIATCRCSLSTFSILKGAPLLKQLNTGALMRIYAVYPKGADGRVWFEGLEKTVTANPLRFVIPISPKTGLIMISYTDGSDTVYWRGLEDKALESAIQHHVKALFPGKAIPAPTYLKKHDWTQGCTYWIPPGLDEPGVPAPYDILKASKEAHHPFPNVYLTGESVNPTQTWMESALESAEYLLSKL